MRMIGRLIFFIVFVIYDWFPLLAGAGYLVGMMTAGYFAVFTSSPRAWTALRHGGEAYLILVGITGMVMTTFSYQNCCVGMNSFPNHLRHYGRKHLENVWVALLWPYGWFAVDRTMRGWGMNYSSIVLNAVHYWVYEIWKGVKLEMLTIENGSVKERTVVRIPSDGK